MIKIIACLVIGVLGYLQAGAQTPVVDSLRSLVQKINAISQDTSCKKYKDKINEKIAAYKSDISKLHLATPANTIMQFLSADSSFLKADYNYYDTKGCHLGKTIMRIIHNLDSLLHGSKGNQSPDSSNIVK